MTTSIGRYERCTIHGRLVTQTPLRIGDGGIVEHDALQRDDGGLIDVSSIEVDADGRACIPASGLKGALRDWCRTNIDAHRFERLFGTELWGLSKAQQKEAIAGRTEFWDAPATGRVTFDHPPPYWNAWRLSGVSTSVAIDRKRRTALEQKLFHAEYVPPGVEFSLTIAGRGLDDCDIDALLMALSALNQDRIRLGACGNDAWGSLGWTLDDVRRVEEDGIRTWVEDGAPTCAYGMLSTLGAETVSELGQKAAEATADLEPPTRLALSIVLAGSFLVNDPARTGQGQDIPDHAPLLNTEGRAYLPAASIRGGLRSQAERILRSMALAEWGQDSDPPDLARIACGGGGDDGCGPIETREEIEKLCLACRVFGAPGWRSPFRVSDFAPAGPEDSGREMTQEFLAIDRFTGGGAEGLKFNAQSNHCPRLTGHLSLDIEALVTAALGGQNGNGSRDGRSRPSWEIGLLALLFRDLQEGDITLGFGAAKGYGAVSKVEWAGAAFPDNLQVWLDLWEGAPPSGSGPEDRIEPQARIEQAIEALSGRVKQQLHLEKGTDHGKA